MLLDGDFIELSVGAKAVFEILRTQPGIQACGVLALTLRRWSRVLNDADRPRLSEWLNELIAARFIMVDKDTEELLVRTFAKWDGGYKNPKRRLSVVASANAVQSESLRAALRVELGKLNIRDCPLASRARSDARPAPSEPRSDPVLTASEPGSIPVPSPIEPGSNGVPSGFDPTRSVVTLGDHNQEPETRNLEGEPAAKPRGHEPPPEFCSKHPGGTDQPCALCGKARLARTDWEAEQTRLAAVARDARRRAAFLARLAAIADCPLCGTNGYRTVPGGHPETHTGGACNHQPLNPGGLARARAATTTTQEAPA
jgi:hypothetical protein